MKAYGSLRNSVSTLIQQMGDSRKPLCFSLDTVYLFRIDKEQAVWVLICSLVFFLLLFFKIYVFYFLQILLSFSSGSLSSCSSLNPVTLYSWNCSSLANCKHWDTAKKARMQAFKIPLSTVLFQMSASKVQMLYSRNAQKCRAKKQTKKAKCKVQTSVGHRVESATIHRLKSCLQSSHLELLL